MKRLERWVDKNTRSLTGKTVAVSGATGGLGRELCRRLCYLGAALVLVDRSMQRSHSLIDELRAEYPEARLEHITLDLEDMTRVREVAKELVAREIDYLVLNAGAYSIPRHKCDTGYDNVYQINFLSPYVLARELLPQIEARGGRVVVVGSIAHNYSKSDPEDVDFSTRRAASKVYGNAKRYLMYALSGERAVTLTHPGIAVTGITGHYPKAVYAVIKYPMKVIFMSPRKACLCILAGLFEDTAENEWIGPRAFDVWGMPRKKALRTADAAEIERIRQTAERIREKIV